MAQEYEIITEKNEKGEVVKATMKWKETKVKEEKPKK